MKVNKVLAIAAAAVGAMTFAADMTISTNYVLDDDLTVDGTLTVASGATVDLNGHVLRANAIAGAGRFTDSKNYEILDYVEANGAQRIVTDLVPNGDTRVDVIATPTDNASSLTLFGTKSWANYRFLCMCQNNNWYFFGKTDIVAKYTAGTRYRFVLGKGYGILFNDETGESLGYKSLNFTNTDNTELAICGVTGSTQRGKFKMYSFKVWQKEEMRFNFVPARNPATGAVGLLNRLDGTLHVSDESAFLPGTATGMLSVGSLRIAAASEAALDGFTGTKDAPCFPSRSQSAARSSSSRKARAHSWRAVRGRRTLAARMCPKAFSTQCADVPPLGCVGRAGNARRRGGVRADAR